MSEKTRFLIAVTICLFIGIIDSFLDASISTSLFYFVPVWLVSYQASRTPGLIVSTLAASIWLGSEILTGQSSISMYVVVWNYVTRVLIFSGFCLLIHSHWVQKNYFQNLANVDELTGSLNRRGFLSKLSTEISRSGRFNRPFSIAFIDIDNFKSVNDTLGHKEGDRLLKRIVEEIKNNIRTLDSVGRLGGDEFAILFIETDEKEIKVAFDKCLTELNATIRNEKWCISFSVGIVTYYNSKKTIEDVLSKADEMMYQVKRSGKNSVVYLVEL